MTTATTGGLAALLREGSQAEHRRAEAQPFVRALVAGRVAPSAYLAFLGRLAAVYGALERAAALLGEDRLAAAVVDPALHRSAALGEDLAFWWEAAGHAPASLRPEELVATTVAGSPATAAYVDRVAASTSWGGLFVAHHYTRYLGDLSGGQAMGRALTRAFDLRDGAGVRFFAFPRVPRVKPYKDRYRERLDALVLDGAARARVLHEVRVAFALNEAVLAELT